jgi:hypothetical protein
MYRGDIIKKEGNVTYVSFYNERQAVNEESFYGTLALVEE